MKAFLRRVFGRAARPAPARLALAAAAGAAVALGQAPWGLWPVALAALVLLTTLVARESAVAPRNWLGWAGGAGYGAGALFWIVEPFLVEPEVYGWMAPFALVLMAAGMAVFWLLPAWIAALGRTQATRAIGFAVGLAASDLLRGYIFTGFPWALVGHIWIGTPVMQAAAWAGPVGLSLLTALMAALPAAATSPRDRALAAGVSLALLAAFWGGGTLLLAASEAPRDPAIRVRLVQPDADQRLKWRADMWRVFLDRLVTATAAPADRPLDLIVWPETALPFLLEQSGPFLTGTLAVAAGGVPVATGVQRSDGARYYNSLAVIDGGGDPVAIYDKWHLVPFGEYIPLGDLAARFGITAFAAQEGAGYTAGPGARVIDLGPAGKVLPLICYEAVFPQDLRAAPDRADWVLQVTNDGWFGRVAGPYQHLAQAQLRAVEQGLPLLRVANTGVTAVIDARGRVLQSLPLGAEGWFDAEVPPSLPRTLYARTGDSPAAILLLSLLAALGFFRRRQSH
ncbi:MAG: apolipoprotein N-acyltransferase [Rhodobacteraceae bacterium]|nr:apolipoprotein N-acyltransferase [Paracoccaceae bacterium]